MYFQLSYKPHQRNYKWIQLRCNNIKSYQHQSCARFINSDRSSFRCPRFPPNFFKVETCPSVSYSMDHSITHWHCPFKIDTGRHPELYSHTLCSSRVPLLVKNSSTFNQCTCPRIPHLHHQGLHIVLCHLRTLQALIELDYEMRNLLHSWHKTVAIYLADVTYLGSVHQTRVQKLFLWVTGQVNVYMQNSTFFCILRISIHDKFKSKRNTNMTNNFWCFVLNEAKMPNFRLTLFQSQSTLLSIPR